MLKLMRFPRGTNRNRTLKPQIELDLDEGDPSAQVEQIFRRFWRERAGMAIEGAAPRSGVGEEQVVCE